MRSDIEYKGELNKPTKNFNYYFYLFLSKINFLYVKYIYNYKNKHKLNKYKIIFYLI